VKLGLSIKYNTNTHALFSFGLKNNKFSCMPRLQNNTPLDSVSYEDFQNPVNTDWYRVKSADFRTDIISRNSLSDPMSINDNTSLNTLPIFDLYSNVTSDTRYGGLTADALYSNT
jgi:hypothetical protein